jgi:hypothetical protein
MKRTTLVSASLLLAFAGCTCGQGWRPNFLTRFNNRFHSASNVGAPCDAGCESGAVHAAPASAGGCESCGQTSANYGGYEGEIMNSYESTPMMQGSSMSYPIQGQTQPYNSGTFQPSVPITARMERIVPKPAN